MSANLAPFKFGDSEIRIAHHEGECVWIAKDVSDALGYAWNGTARIKHVPDEWRGVTSVVTPSGEQEMAYLTEAGLFFFLNRSDKPAALPLQKWVAGEILPAIRKTGGYMVAAPEETPEELAIRAVNVLQATVARQKAALDEAAPQIDAYKALASLEGVHNIRWSAQQCGWPERKFSEKLCEIKWCYRHPVTGRLTVYRNTIDRGLMDTKNVEVKRTGHIEGVGQPMITQKGLAELRSILGPYESNKRADAMNAEIATRSKKKASPVPFSQTPA